MRIGLTITLAMFMSLVGAAHGADSLHNDPATAPISTTAAIKAGSVERVKTLSDGEASYSLFLPTAYEKEPSRVFPLVINQNPSGRTRIGVYQQWAEEQGVILLGLDGISNGKEQGAKNKIADAVLKDLTARGIRAHETLRVTIGMSGGSADGMRLVRRKPEHYAGCVFMGAGSIIDNPKGKGLAYAILGGAKDEWMAGDACYAMVEKAQSLGCPTIVEVEIDRQHQEAPLARQAAALTWLLELQKLQLPSLPKEEREHNIAAARERMKNIGSIKDSAMRRAEAELLLKLPPLKEFQDDWAAVAVEWANTVLKLADSANEGRTTFMCEALRSPFLAEVPAGAKEHLEAVATGLRNDPATAKDWALCAKYLDAEDAEIRAGLKPDKLAEAMSLWEALRKESVGTAWEEKVKRRIANVRVFVETPSTIQHPTRVPK